MITKPKVVYHVSDEIGLKHFNPRVLNSYHADNYRGKAVIYLTSSLTYASAFSFPWNDDEVSLGSYDNNKTFELEFLTNESLERMLNVGAVSLYEFKYNDNLMQPLDTPTPEFISSSILTVSDEMIFTTTLDCLVYSGIKLIKGNTTLNTNALRMKQRRINCRHKSLSL